MHDVTPTSFQNINLEPRSPITGLNSLLNDFTGASQPKQTTNHTLRSNR